MMNYPIFFDVGPIPIRGRYDFSHSDASTIIGAFVVEDFLQGSKANLNALRVERDREIADELVTFYSFFHGSI